MIGAIIGATMFIFHNAGNGHLDFPATEHYQDMGQCETAKTSLLKALGNRGSTLTIVCVAKDRP